jgi:hypothetical protein
MNKSIFVWLCLGFILGGCEPDIPADDEVLEPLSEIPKMVSADIRLEDNAYWLQVTVEDGDGNIGTTDPDDQIVRVVDGRDPSIVVFYPLPPVAPLGDRVAVRAHFDLELIKPESTINGSSSWFCRVSVMDRSLNLSDTLETNIVNLN